MVLEISSAFFILVRESGEMFNSNSNSNSFQFGNVSASVERSICSGDLVLVDSPTNKLHGRKLYVKLNGSSVYLCEDKYLNNILGTCSRTKVSRVNGDDNNELFDEDDVIAIKNKQLELKNKQLENELNALQEKYCQLQYFHQNLSDNYKILQKQNETYKSKELLFRTENEKMHQKIIELTQIKNEKESEVEKLSKELKEMSKSNCILYNRLQPLIVEMEKRKMKEIEENLQRKQKQIEEEYQKLQKELEKKVEMKKKLTDLNQQFELSQSSFTVDKIDGESKDAYNYFNTSVS